MQSLCRRFGLNDQRAFADLSGDHNPMHLDVQGARRLLLGSVAVHGIHLVLWALEPVRSPLRELAGVAVTPRPFR